MHHLEIAAGAAAKLAVAAGIGAVLVMQEQERKAHLGHLDRAELDAAGRVPLADRVIAVAGDRAAAAGPRLEQMPDEAAARARVLALDGDAEAAAPAAHDAIGAGRRQRHHDRLDDLVRAVARAHGHGRPSLAHTIVPGRALTVSGRSEPAFFGMSGSIR